MVKHRKDTLNKYASLDSDLKVVDGKVFCDCCHSEVRSFYNLLLIKIYDHLIIFVVA